MIFHQTDSDSIPNTWVLLDSQSTVNIFKNPAFLTNIRESPSGHLRVLTNGGLCTSHLVGDLPNFGTVWFNPQSLANILSLRAVRQICCVTMDTDQEAAILVHRKDGSIMRFLEFRSGLYYFDASTAVSTTASNKGYCFIDTVPANLASFTRREIEGANVAKALYRKLERPSQATFEHLLLLTSFATVHSLLTMPDVPRTFTAPTLLASRAKQPVAAQLTFPTWLWLPYLQQSWNFIARSSSQSISSLSKVMFSSIPSPARYSLGRPN